MDRADMPLLDALAADNPELAEALAVFQRAVQRKDAAEIDCQVAAIRLKLAYQRAVHSASPI